MVLQPIAGEDKEVHTFPKSISSKVNVIASLEFEHAYYDVAVLHVSHDATGTPPKNLVSTSSKNSELSGIIV